MHLVSGVVLNVGYDGSVVVKVDQNAEGFMFFGVRFPEPEDSIRPDARRLCCKMVKKLAGNIFIPAGSRDAGRHGAALK
jgi:hypothetical protein